MVRYVLGAAPRQILGAAAALDADECSLVAVLVSFGSSEGAKVNRGTVRATNPLVWSVCVACVSPLLSSPPSSVTPPGPLLLLDQSRLKVV